jgi:RNA polymerase sigma factor (sigma-70 family)
MSGTKGQFSDIDFIGGLRGGDNVVLAALYKKYYQFVLKFVVKNSGTEEAARDIYQEAIIVLYEKAQDPGFVLTCQLQTYIYSVVKRLWLKHLRASGKSYLFKDDEENEVADVSADLNEHLEKEKDIIKMTKSLAELGEPCSSLIRDYYVHHLGMDQIAEKFGYSNADSAKNQKYKCLQRLKKYFFEKNIVAQE